MKTFTLHCGSGTRETRVDDWDFTVYGDEMEMSCKIVRRDRLPWREIQSGVMMFKDSEGKLHEGTYVNWWWRARVPLREAKTGIRYWPHELNEGNKQNVSTCEVEPRQLGHYPLVAQPEPELVIEMPEPKIALAEAIIAEPKPEPEGVVTPFAVLGDEDDRPIEEVIEEFKGLVKEATEEPSEAAEAVAEKLEKELAKPKPKETPPKAEPEAKPAWTGGMEKAAKKRKAKKKILTCPVCGVTTTKNGKPFKSALSVKRHVAAAHKTRDTE